MGNNNEMTDTERNAEIEKVQGTSRTLEMQLSNSEESQYVTPTANNHETNINRLAKAFKETGIDPRPQAAKANEEEPKKHSLSANFPYQHILATSVRLADGRTLKAVNLRRPTGGDIKKAKRLCRDNGEDVIHDLDNYLIAQLAKEKLIPADLENLDGYDIIQIAQQLQKAVGKPR